MSQNIEPLVLNVDVPPRSRADPHPVSMYEEVETLLMRANLHIFEEYETERPNLAAALRQNIRNAQEVVRRRQRTPHDIVDEHIFMEFSIMEGWNLHRLGYLVPWGSDEGFYDLFDDDTMFPLRYVAREAGVTVQGRPWMRVRSNPQPPREHQHIAHEFMRGNYNGVRLRAATRHALELMGLGAPGNQQHQRAAASVQSPAATTARKTAARTQAQIPVLSNSAPRGLAMSPVPAALPAPTIAQMRPQTELTPTHISRKASVSKPVSVLEHPGRVANLLDFQPSAMLENAPQIAPIFPAQLVTHAQNVAAATSKTAAKKPRVHVGLKDAPSPNVPLPVATATTPVNFTIVELMCFLPQIVRSIDLINRVCQNGGNQQPLANMVSAHRKNAVLANFMYHLMKPEMQSLGGSYAKWTPKENPVDVNYDRDTINMAGLRTLEHATPERASLTKYPNASIKFRDLANNVRHFPVGHDALDLTRCVQYIVDHPEGTGDLMFPDDYATVLTVVGGPLPVTTHQLDRSAFARWTGAEAKRRAEGNDAAWERECADHRGRYWSRDRGDSESDDHGVSSVSTSTRTTLMKRARGDDDDSSQVTEGNDDMPLKKRLRKQNPNPALISISVEGTGNSAVTTQTSSSKRHSREVEAIANSEADESEDRQRPGKRPRLSSNSDDRE